LAGNAGAPEEPANPTGHPPRAAHARPAKAALSYHWAVKRKYARPQAIVRKDAEAWKIVDEARTATMGRNEHPVPDAFKDAARRIDAALAGG
jgi:hypothetical protein